MNSNRLFPKAVAFACILLSAGALLAQEEGAVPLTVRQAVDYANANSKTLKSSAIDLEMKRRASDLVWNQFLPSVSMSATAAYTAEVSDPTAITRRYVSPIYKMQGIDEPPAPDLPNWTGFGTIDVSWNFSFALVDGIRIIKKNYEAGLITWDQALKQNELQIKKMFYGLLLQQESLALQRQSLVNAEQRVRQAEINYRNGRIPELQLLQTQVSYENKKPAVLKLEQAVSQQLDLFAFMLGMPPGTKVALQGEIEPEFLTLDADRLIASHIGSNPDILALQKNLEILRLNLSVQNFQAFTPTLILSGGFQPVISDLTANWADNYSDNFSFSATLAWNLTNMLPFSTTRQQAKDTKANIEKLELSLSTLIEKTELDIRTQVDALAQARASIEAATGSISLAQKSYDMTLASFRNGTSELLDLRDAEDQLNQAKLGLVNEKYNYLSGLLDLEYMLNTKLTDIQGE